jgi:type VI secretion system secreted protein Hcp
MAIDVYLQIDGIKGESQDATHQGWIEVVQAQWGVMQPILESPGSGTGGRTTGRSEYRTLSLAKLADLASPVLMQHCSNGKTIPKAKLEMMRADGDGKRVKYYEVELENVLIANMEQMVGEGSILRDHIALHFTKVKWKYSQQKIGGGMGGQTAGGWDLSCNKSCA